MPQKALGEESNIAHNDEAPCKLFGGRCPEFQEMHRRSVSAITAGTEMSRIRKPPSDRALFERRRTPSQDSASSDNILEYLTPGSCCMHTFLVASIPELLRGVVELQLHAESV